MPIPECYEAFQPTEGRTMKPLSAKDVAWLAMLLGCVLFLFIVACLWLHGVA